MLASDGSGHGLSHIPDELPSIAGVPLETVMIGDQTLVSGPASITDAGGIHRIIYQRKESYHHGNIPTIDAA